MWVVGFMTDSDTRYSRVVDFKTDARPGTESSGLHD